ncbi:MAG: 2-oxoacid:ferredoxin oxidoreductase subunit gamma, partial [Candidatus Omnitrophota bacterium]|nr:2-oxoacid:ferredoxin oxidoreductase subunit gamma [Candidatus Omnitrophota bacterium]
MKEEILFAGFGGQGIMFMGKAIACAAMNEGKHVTWIPSY